MGIVGLVETIAMLMGRKEKLAAGLIKYRSPELAAGTLPLGKVTRVVGMSVGRIKVAGIHLRAWVEERNVTERHEERRMLYLRLPKSIAKPLLLRHTIRFADEKVAELRVGVQLILSRIETNEGHIAHADCKVAPQVPIARQTFLWLAIHPHTFQMTVRHASVVMIAGTEEIRDVRSIVFAVYLWLEEDTLLCRNSLFGVTGIAVPDDARGL